MPMVDHALGYARRGLSVFPCVPGQKVPATKHGFKDATLNPQTIESWWRSWGECNIGVATGEISGILVLDIDTKKKDGEKELRQLEAQHGELPATVESVTPGGGRHIFFRWPGWPVKRDPAAINPSYWAALFLVRGRGQRLRRRAAMGARSSQGHRRRRAYGRFADTGRRLASISC